MLLDILGTIKIDSEERKQHLLHNLRSMEPILPLLRWRLNVVGRHAEFARAEIAKRCPAEITIDDTTPTYHLQRAQMDAICRDASVFMWQEDHWFLCPHANLFLYLLERFWHYNMDVLTITHLTTSWTNKRWLPVIADNPFYTTYRVDAEAQERVWEKHPGGYLSGVPAIYRWRFADAVLEFKKDHMSKTTLPEFELAPGIGREFLTRHSFTEIIPKFHVFREVFAVNRHPRSVSMDNALKWLELRETGDIFGGHPGNYRADRRDNV
jgi:hypothetical protein